MINMGAQLSNGNNSPNINGNNNSVIIGIKKNVANEVKTIELIINTLTRLSKISLQDELTGDRNIDPDKKISRRFSEYSDQLTLLYTNLSIKYSGLYETVQKENQISRIDIDSVSSFLRIKSSYFLEKNSQNPILALHDLSEYLEKEFCGEDIKDFEYDDGAVNFYLYNQLIRCNVFPNPIQ